MYLISKHSKILIKWCSQNSLKPKSCFQRAVQCCPRVAAAPSLPNSPITQLSPYFIRKPGTGLALPFIEIALPTYPLHLFTKWSVRARAGGRSSVGSRMEGSSSSLCDANRRSLCPPFKTKVCVFIHTRSLGGPFEEMGMEEVQFN